MTRAAVFGMCVVVAGLSGCTAPQVIRQDQSSVVLAIPENTNVWPTYYQDEAKAMAGKIISDPVLVSSQRVKVGESITNTQDSTRRDIGGTNNQPRVGEVTSASNTTSVSDRNEFHLEFRSMTPTRGQGFTPAAPIPGGSPMLSNGNKPAPNGANDPRMIRPVDPGAGIAPAGFPSTGLPR